MNENKKWDFSGAEEEFDSAFKGEDASKKTRADKEQIDKESKERVESIGKLVDFYRKVILADKPSDIFGATDYSMSKDQQLITLKKTWSKLAMEFHEDKYNGQRATNPFPAEITNVARKASQILNAFFDEANEKIKGGMSVTKEMTRRNNQRAHAATMEADIASGMAAEEKINAHKENTGEEKKEENANTNSGEKENGDTNRNAEQETNGESKEGEGNKKDSEDAEFKKENGAEDTEKKESLFGLPEKVFGAFKNGGIRAWETYEDELSGKNGEKGYLDKFSSIQKRNYFLGTLVEVIVQEKITEKMTILIDKYDFAVDNLTELVEYIVESIKKDKTK